MIAVLFIIAATWLFVWWLRFTIILNGCGVPLARRDRAAPHDPHHHTATLQLT
jgi:hypothetical protein